MTNIQKKKPSLGKEESACTGTTDTLALSRNRRNELMTGSTLPSPEKPYLSRSEVAALWGVNPRTVERLEYDGELTAYRLGRSVRYKRSEVDAWAEAQAR